MFCVDTFGLSLAFSPPVVPMQVIDMELQVALDIPFAIEVQPGN